jgi:hypothetical protein
MTFALFGEKQFGIFQFGQGVLTRPRFALEIDWDGDGFFDGRNDGLWLNSLKWERGKRYTIASNGSGFEDEMTGTIIGTVLDLEGWYDPFTNPNIGSGRAFRLWVRTPSDNVFDLMAGTLGEPVIENGRGVPRVQLSGEDGWGVLRDQRNRVTVAFQQDIYGGDAMNLLLDKIGWSRTWGRSLDLGYDQHPFWWADDKSAAQALFDLAFSEMGKLWIAGDGAITFRNRHFADTSMFTITDDDVYLGSLKVLEPWDVVRNSIRVTATIPTLQEDIILWQSLEVIPLTAGESYEKFVDFTYNGASVAVESLIDPVAGFDYVANTNADGSGVNITSAISIVIDLFSTNGKMTVKNNGSQAGYVLTPLTIRGNAMTSQQTTSEAESPVSQQRYKTRSLDIVYPWIHNDNIASYIAKRLRDRLAIPGKYLAFTMKANPDKQFAMDLGKQVDVNIVSKGISGTYRVYYVRGQWTDAAGLNTNTDVMLEPVEDRGDVWVVPDTVPMVVA